MDMKTDVTIRMVERGDTQILMDFINTLSNEQTYIMAQGRQWTFTEEDAYVDGYMKSISDGNAVKFLALHAGALVGVADVIRSHYETEPHIGTFGITVARDWRGKGIGSKLMDVTLAAVSQRMPDIRMVRLGVFSNNPIAEHLYAKKGFVRYGVLPRGLLHKGSWVDHVFMYKLL